MYYLMQYKVLLYIAIKYLENLGVAENRYLEDRSSDILEI